jgi:hypothetical protein
MESINLTPPLRMQLAHQLAYITAETVHSPVSYAYFGYRRQPRLGGIFDLFRARWRRELDLRLYRQVAITQLATFVECKYATLNDVFTALQIMIPSSFVAECYGYSDMVEAQDQMFEGVEAYCSADVDTWPTTLFMNCGGPQLPDSTEKENIFVGAALFLTNTRFSLLRDSGIRSALGIQDKE